LDFQKAKEYLESVDGKVVIKASGLAAGKGVILPETKAEAIIGLKEIMNGDLFGDAGSEVVIEERLEGEEVSCLAITDGYTVVPLPGAQDHKRAYDGDQVRLTYLGAEHWWDGLLCSCTNIHS
jgi:phosphoribosylamine--glycine ligase/phosphoribosylformylglycinamidine cyclo-ligase